MPQSAQIRVLSDHVANKIAAGEVVERPASVLKELIENALDAGAGDIDVKIVAGGKKAVVVADDGSGMTRNDALLSIERHATSKISDVDDIEAIATLGFRGEALAAISSVSRFTLQTRRKGDDEGVELVMSGGNVSDVGDIGCPEGTIVAVRHLFHNVPARRKFLRSEQTEQSHLRQVFLTYALAFPAVGFTLTSDDRQLYRLAGNSTSEDRLRDLFGDELVRNLKRIHLESEGVLITGYAGVPQASRTDRSEQFVFVNRRPASAPVLFHAIREAYGDLLPKDRHPSLFLFVDLDPSTLDVNVHPTKREVRFRQPSYVRDAVIEAIRSALSGEGPARRTADAADEFDGAGSPMAAKPLVEIRDIPQLPTFSYPKIPLAQGDVVDPAPVDGEAAGETAEGSQGPWASCRILGQVGGLYVVMETEDGLVLMDPHAAHERILYEAFMREVLANKVNSQGLLAPETVELAPRESLRVRENLETLRAMGFGISEFGGDTFIVDALPTCLGDISAKSILVAVSETIEQGGVRGSTQKWAAERVAQVACRTAVRARDKLSLQEIEKLVINLARAEMPYTCPHGRPTLILMSYRELDRKFGRS